MLVSINKATFVQIIIYVSLLKKPEAVLWRIYVNVVPFRILFSLCEDNIGASKTLMTFMLFILITCKLCTGGMIIRTTKPKKPKKGKY